MARSKTTTTLSKRGAPRKMLATHAARRRSPPKSSQKYRELATIPLITPEKEDVLLSRMCEKLKTQDDINRYWQRKKIKIEHLISAVKTCAKQNNLINPVKKSHLPLLTTQSNIPVLQNKKCSKLFTQARLNLFWVRKKYTINNILKRISYCIDMNGLKNPVLSDSVLFSDEYVEID